MKARHILVVLLVLAILLPACGGTAAPTAAPATKPAGATSVPATTAGQPKSGGVVNFAMSASPPTADSPTTTALATQILTIHINEWLVALGEQYNIVPMLAESWKVSDDGLTWTFALRKGVKFHNGAVMTSDDVIASYNRFMVVSPRASAFSIVTNVAAPDANTVVFTCNKKTGQFLTNLASVLGDLPIQPKSAIIGADGKPKAANALKVPDEIIGTGPYKLADYKPDSVIVLKKNEFYQALPGKLDGLGGNKTPYFDEVRINIVPDATAQTAGLESGAYDYINNIPNADFIRFRDNPVPGVTAVSIYPGQAMMMFFNFGDKFSANLKFRQAIAAGLDMEEIALFETNGDKQMFRLNPYFWPKEGAMYLPNDPVAEATYNQKNVEKAKQLLKEAGYNGEELVYATTRDYEMMYRHAVAITDQMNNKLGMKVKVEVYDWAALNALWETKTGFAFTGSTYSSYNFLPIVLRTYWYSTSKSGEPSLGYVSADMDKALDAADAAITVEEQQTAWRQFQKVFWTEMPNLKLYDSPSLSAFRSNLKGFIPWYRPRLFGAWRE